MSERVAVHVAGSTTISEAGKPRRLLRTPEGSLVVTVSRSDVASPGRPAVIVMLDNRTEQPLAAVLAGSLNGASSRLEPGENRFELTIEAGGTVLALQAGPLREAPRRERHVFSLLITADEVADGIELVGQLIAGQVG